MRYGQQFNPYMRKPDGYARDAEFRNMRVIPHNITPYGFNGDDPIGGDAGIPAWGGSYWYPEPPIRQMPGPQAQIFERNNQPVPGFGGMDNAWYGTAGFRDMGQRMQEGEAAAALGRQWGRGWAGQDDAVGGNREQDFSQIYTHPMTAGLGKGWNLSGMTEEEWDATPQRDYWEDYYPLMEYMKRDPQF